MDHRVHTESSNLVRVKLYYIFVILLMYSVPDERFKSSHGGEDSSRGLLGVTTQKTSTRFILICEA